ncbi:DUF4214 domain-containing protein [uncultured Ramlibacter sp.]|uniref:DUF4214 domain-containing protein n=1 Tax=uncultured Ramlibacter sp. TaxID=260755 RepID=UPI002629C4E5|nr:DUF4214 domain-containing protein [uncultured Ramlibacter sp.]
MHTPLHFPSRFMSGVLLTTVLLLGACGGGGPAEVAGGQAPQSAETPMAADVLSGYSGQAYRMYQAAFDRAPDAQGLAYYVDKLSTGQLTLKNMAVGFFNSPEFKARYGEVSPRIFVELLYQNVLGRAPDTAGLFFHESNLATRRLDYADTLASFSESPENIERVATKYNASTGSGGAGQLRFYLYQPMHAGPSATVNPGCYSQTISVAKPAESSAQSFANAKIIFDSYYAQMRAKCIAAADGQRILPRPDGTVMGGEWNVINDEKLAGAEAARDNMIRQYPGQQIMVTLAVQ